jgi:hypothetical protein
LKVKTRVSLYQPPVQIEKQRPLHVGVQVDGVRSKWESPVVIILRDTNGSPLIDTGYGVITCPTLTSGIKVNGLSGAKPPWVI